MSRSTHARSSSPTHPTQGGAEGTAKRTLLRLEDEYPEDYARSESAPVAQATLTGLWASDPAIPDPGAPDDAAVTDLQLEALEPSPAAAAEGADEPEAATARARSYSGGDALSLVEEDPAPRAPEISEAPSHLSALELAARDEDLMSAGDDASPLEFVPLDMQDGIALPDEAPASPVPAGSPVADHPLGRSGKAIAAESGSLAPPEATDSLGAQHPPSVPSFEPFTPTPELTLASTSPPCGAPETPPIAAQEQPVSGPASGLSSPRENPPTEWSPTDAAPDDDERGTAPFVELAIPDVALGPATPHPEALDAAAGEPESDLAPEAVAESQGDRAEVPESESPPEDPERRRGPRPIPPSPAFRVWFDEAANPLVRRIERSTPAKVTWALSVLVALAWSGWLLGPGLDALDQHARRLHYRERLDTEARELGALWKTSTLAKAERALEQEQARIAPSYRELSQWLSQISRSAFEHGVLVGYALDPATPIEELAGVHRLPLRLELSATAHRPVPYAQLLAVLDDILSAKWRIHLEAGVTSAHSGTAMIGVRLAMLVRETEVTP